MIHELEGEIITLVPVTVGKIVPDGTPEEEWKWLTDAVKECYGYAKKKGVRVAIEPLNRFETYCLSLADPGPALADAIAPHCGVCIDAFNRNIEDADMYPTIKKAGKQHYEV